MESNELFRRPTSQINSKPEPSFIEKYGLTENPFPANSTINKNSTEKKNNGSIYEKSIRENEYNQILENFIKIPQSDINHSRLGYLVDQSFIVRGNGKTTFLFNLQNEINNDFSMSLSNNTNKCFALHFSPENNSKSKHFEFIVDTIFSSIFKLNIIELSLAILRYETLIRLGIDIQTKLETNGDNIIENLNDYSWLNTNVKEIFASELNKEVLNNEFLKDLPEGFPLFSQNSVARIPVKNDFKEYYYFLKKENDKIEFVFDGLVKLFLAAGFNGAYVFIDDFERITDFQSATQKKEMAVRLRSILFDGQLFNAKIGFYNFILALHAGVARTLSDAWSTSGIDQRVPLAPNYPAKHIVKFEKLELKHVIALIEKYLKEFRIANYAGDSLFPFNEEVVKKIAEDNEYNPSKILQLSFNLIENAAKNKHEKIDITFLNDFLTNNTTEVDTSRDIASADGVDLTAKFGGIDE